MAGGPKKDDKRGAPAAFVSLKSLTRGAPEPAEALAEIRRIYFKTTAKTIEHDIAHAIALLKALPDEDARARATVFMHGLEEMRREWTKGRPKPSPRGRGRKPTS